jgi:hypothetical protein
MVPGAGGDVNTVLPLILSILSTLCCGYCIGFGLGIAGIVFSVQAMNAKKAGDMTTAASKAKLALILGGVGLALGLIADILGWALGAADSMMRNY